MGRSPMKRVLRALALAGALVCVPIAADAADFVTAGNSHAVYVAKQMKWMTVAKDGALTSDLPAQLARAPFGAFVLVITGTNDAQSKFLMNLAVFHARTALDVAAWRGQKLVWAGPSAVQRAGWWQRAELIDGQFEALMEERGIPYLSIFTDPAMKPVDEVHLSASSSWVLGITAAHLLHD